MIGTAQSAREHFSDLGKYVPLDFCDGLQMPDTRIPQEDRQQRAHTEPIHQAGGEPARRRQSQLRSGPPLLCPNEPMIPNSEGWHLPGELRRALAVPVLRPVECNLILHSIFQDEKGPVFWLEARIDVRTSLRLQSPIWADPRIQDIAQTHPLLVGLVRCSQWSPALADLEAHCAQQPD